jgi:predicted DsbA family dithiol-disulfide isomerase
VRLARPKGTQHALANAIAEAYFIEHRPFNEDAVLVELAGRHGFSREETLAVLADPAELARTAELAAFAAGQGISGVPFFIFDNRLAMSGCQPDAMFDRALRQALAPEAEKPLRA